MALITNVNDPNRARYGLIETFTTEQTNPTLVLSPDGNNGVNWIEQTVLPYTLIKTLSDLPTAVGSVITLDVDNTNYVFSGVVDLGDNVINVTASNIKFLGLNSSTDGVSSTTTGVLITANKGVIYSSERMTYLGGTTQIDVDNFDTVAVRFGLHQLCTNVIKLNGSLKSYLHSSCLFRDITGVGIDLGTAIFSAIGISLCTCVNTATTTFISVLANSGNLIPTGEGTITDCKIDDDLGGVGSSGYSPLDLLWYVTGTRGILTSDRVLFSGWEFAVDGLVTVPTLSVTTTESKLLIDSVGATSNAAYLPIAIRGISNLWDSTNSCIKGIIVGDSFDMRVQLIIDALAGNPTELTIILDIGGGATPSIIIAQDTKPVRGLTEPVIFSFPIFTLGTFIANGGQIFLKSDTGTITIGGRSIFLSRTSSGSS
jgi:hypothetical protein